jgi:hypothetical protein
MPRHIVARRLLFPTFAFLGLVTIAGCPKQQADQSGKEGIPGQKVSGSITYEGKPVPYGVIRFYHLGDQSKGAIPTASALIDADGTYSVPNVASGMKMVCIFADPEVDPLSVLGEPEGLGGGGALGGPGHGSPMAGGGPPMAGAGPPVGGGGPPMAGGGPPVGGGGPPVAGGGPPMAGGGPPVGGGAPPMAGGPPVGGGGPPMGGGGRPQKPGGGKGHKNPLAEKLTDDQKAMLVKVHALYGTARKSPLIYLVLEGDQTHNFTLPLK